MADGEHEDTVDGRFPAPGRGVWSVVLAVLAMAALGALLRLIFDLLF